MFNFFQNNSITKTKVIFHELIFQWEMVLSVSIEHDSRVLPTVPKQANTVAYQHIRYHAWQLVMQSIRRSWFSGRRVETYIKSEEKWEAVRDSRRERSWKIQFKSYFYTATVTALRWRQVSMKQKLWKVNLNPVKCVKIFSEKSYLLFIFACSVLWGKSWESQYVLKKIKSLAPRGGTFCHNC